MNTFLDNSIIDAVIYRLQEQSKVLFGSKDKPSIKCIFFEDRPYSKLALLSVSASEYKKNLYVKIDKNNGDTQKEFNALSFFYKEFQGQTKYGIIKPIAYYEAPPAIVTEDGIGTTLANIIKKARLFPSKGNLNFLTTLSKNCGECLRYLQSIWPIPKNIVENKPYNYEETLFSVHNQLSKCLEDRLLNKKIINLIRNYVDLKAQKIINTKIKITGMHSDFIPSNILINGEKVNILDFEGFKLGPSCRDVANFLYSLDILQTNPMFRPSTINKLKKGFLDGYGWSKEAENLQLFYLFYVCEILGGLLTFSERITNNITSRLKCLRWSMLTEKFLLSIMNEKPII